MKVEEVFGETKAVFQTLLKSSLLDNCDTFREKRIALANVTSDFFLICEVLHDNQEVTGSQKYCFRHRVMSHAIIIAIQKSESLSIDELDREEILNRYAEDWESSQKV